MIQSTDTIPCVEFRAAPADLPVVEAILEAAELLWSSYTNLETAQAMVWVFTDSPAEAATIADHLNTALAARRPDLTGALPRAVATMLRQEDWAHSWQRLFKAFRVSPRLVLKPTWETWPAEPRDIILELDPGMCFGTGYHGTTRACLEFMDDLAEHHGRVSLLDAGCGSGILSLAAVRLGFEPVAAFDHDPQAVAMTQANLERAGAGRVEVRCADLADFTPARPSRVVVANILATALIEHRQRLCQWLDTSGGPAALVLAGILTAQYPDVLAAFTSLGCREVDRRTIDEWTSGRFEVAPATHRT